MPEHSLITDPNIHEPKGASTASEGMVYVANGSGSGTWRSWPYGKAVYQHLLTTAQVVTTTPTKLQINGEGPLTQTGRLPRDHAGGSLWHVTDFKITPIRTNDTYLIRLDMPVTSETSSPTEMLVQFDIGGGATPTNIITSHYLKAGRAGAYTQGFSTVIDVASTAVVNNGIQIFVRTDVGSITLANPTITIVKVIDGVL